MPTPSYSLGAPGGVLNAVSVPKSSTIAAFIDVSSLFKSDLLCQADTGTTAPASGNGTSFSAYPVAGNQTTNMLSTAVAVGATSISVTSRTAINPNQKIALIAAASGVGEVVTVTGAPTGTGPYAVPISATLNAYAANDHAYLMAQTTTLAVNPMPITPGVSSDYSMQLSVETGQYILAVNNPDTAQPVTATVSRNDLQKYQ